MAIGYDGSIYAWGANDHQQLGRGDSGGKPLDIEKSLPHLSMAVAVAAGEAHSLCLRANGAVSAWGANDRG